MYQTLIKLCVDICKRNGKTKLLWLGDKTKTLSYTPKPDEMILTVHRWFANKSCPGNWMYARMGDLAKKVTAALGGDMKPAKPVKPSVTIKVGDLVTITGSTYYNGKSIPKWVKGKNWYVLQTDGARVVIDKSEDGKNAICSPVNAADLQLVNAKPGKTVDELAREVIRGLWGNGTERKNRLTEAGYDYRAVQRRVNELLR